MSISEHDALTYADMTSELLHPFSSSASTERSDAIHGYVDSTSSDMLVELTDWIGIRSIAGAPESAAHLRESAQWLAERFRGIGFPAVEILATGDSSAVYAEWITDVDAPTYLIYSHHDVRATKEASWTVTEPFTPLLRGTRLYGRGSSDAKGQVMAHLWGLRAYLAATERSAPGVNLKFLIEGEEETGSAHLAELLETHADRFAADVIVFSDTLQWSIKHPALCTSIRGMVGAQLELRGPEHDIHSGAVSGPAPNPIIELSRLVADLHDDLGRIALPHFYDEVIEPTIERRGQLADLPFEEHTWIQESHTERAVGECSYSVLERLWLRPSLEVITFTGGDSFDPPRAVIPATAQVSLSIRTVLGQKAHSVAEQLREFVAARVPASQYTLEISEATAQEPYETPAHPAVDLLAQAMSVGHRVPAVGRMGNAGGGPAELMSRVLDAPVVFYGTGLVGDNWHDGDESVDTVLLKAGAATLGAFWCLATEQATHGDQADSSGRAYEPVVWGED
ncbi:acetylornithine deacetylase/succinyl-diaminopimelate desuccinylase-like protein [Okibacterium sp. HSC-33S16]|uniref:M20/M25/M40 family metallo-hydrolase n=1 Tax=Okibacterium sp. HSC-33S16 TaxID=2910965 RepID=UPI0020A1BAE1|nr:M20/M25/M40 family metallo-hydrolase [Okibacterium sp. HSC-33S16]MCP2031315.1 acetylornithine deacetylase/succinyl-diaminopimelate desuccinylase-like protein [Okibacterium sp. HSC-33S16]